MFRWEWEGCYCHRHCTVIGPFWFLTEHLCKSLIDLLALNWRYDTFTPPHYSIHSIMFFFFFHLQLTDQHRAYIQIQEECKRHSKELHDLQRKKVSIAGLKKMITNMSSVWWQDLISQKCQVFRRAQETWLP